MADRPIIFSAPMVRALLAGRKTQTRRLFRPRGFEFYTHPISGDRYNEYRPYRDGTWDQSRISGSGPMQAFGWGEGLYAYLPFAPGDCLYVRESIYFWSSGHDGEITYAADGRAWHTGPNTGDIPDSALPGYFKMVDRSVRERGRISRPSIHMPRWASRLTLTVEDVRVQRLGHMSETDAIDEGIYCERQEGWTADGSTWWASPKTAFHQLWNSLHGPDAWAENPWVVALTFSVQRGNIDRLEVRP